MHPHATAVPGRFFIGMTLLALFIAIPASAQETEGPLVKMLRSGRVPEERQSTIVGMIGQRGTSADLEYLLGRALDPKGFAPATRVKALDALHEAALTRKLRPNGDLAVLRGLIEAPDDPAARLSAIRLAGLWRLDAAVEPLATIAGRKELDAPTRAAALDALAAIGGEVGGKRIVGLTGPDQPLPTRALAVAALARLDPVAAAEHAVAVLRAAKEGVDLTPLLHAFVQRQDGPEKLAAALGGASLPADSAKLALRALYAIGRSDAPLVAVLSRAAGLDAEIKVPTAAEMQTLVAEVGAHGDAARGEAVFRRADLNCTKCHALVGAGGGIGPDLSAIGQSTPVDFLVNSIIDPDQAIKEQFNTLVVLTSDGQIYQGIVADRDEKRVVLKDATGEQRTVPADAIEDSKAGGSLMPKGLSALMTHAEFVDLLRFLSELGKPGPFAIRATPTIQRWRVLRPVGEPLANGVPEPSTLRHAVLGAGESSWLPAYALVSGDLPLDELVKVVGAPVLYLQGALNVSSPGPVTFRLNAPEGVSAWLDESALPAGEAMTAELTAGAHALTLRVDTAKRGNRALRLEVVKPAGSAAEYTIVGGR